jgi:hypothetical protein
MVLDRNITKICPELPGNQLSAYIFFKFCMLSVAPTATENVLRHHFVGSEGLIKLPGVKKKKDKMLKECLFFAFFFLNYFFNH